LKTLLRPFIDPLTYLGAVHLLANLVVGTVTFSVAITMLSLSLGLSVFIFGLPLLMVTVLLGRWVASVERRRAALLLGAETRTPPALHRTGLPFWQWVKRVVTDLPGWKGLIYSIVLFPWGVITFTVTITMAATALFLISFPAWSWAVENTINDRVLTTGESVGVSLAGAFVGVVLLVASPWAIRLMVAVDKLLIQGLLSGPREAELEARVEQLTQTRAAAVSSADETLRRIERDLHDGAQQRLVALALDLGMARERVAKGESADRVLELVDRAHDEAKRSIVELRELVRGIHPAVLSDRGLDAALSALAARSPIPVTIDVQILGRPPANIEAAAYFVVAEALTNVAKHSNASHSSVIVRRSPTELLMTLWDNGRGGAVITPTGGLGGLVDRVRAIDGTVEVTSPVGGPTTIEVRIPCVS
jgi:signal transduction histidine kinase